MNLLRLPCLAAVLWLTAASSVTSRVHGAETPPTPLNYSVSWIGNTFSGGDAGWVPQDVQDIFVTPDGTVYTTVGWEEHRGNIAAFQNGALLQQTAHWKRGGLDRLVGETITANSNHLYFATGKSGPGDHDGKVMGTSLARRDRADLAARKFERRVEVGVRIEGVAASEERVWAACADGRVRVFDAELKALGDWAVPSPGEMALDDQGNLWIIDTGARVVRRFTADGQALPQEVRLPSGVVPTDVAMTPDQRLLIADGGTNRQVRVYRHLDTAPELERTLGEPGGVFGGERPGAFGDRRFIAPIGVGADARGNLYVACGPYAGTHGGTAILQSYAPDGRLNWRILSSEWLDTVDVDRSSDATLLYGSRHRYTLDLSRPPGQQWSLAAFTVHPDKYPDDPRLKSAAVGGVWHRTIQGRSYLFMGDMNGGHLYVFRLDPLREGEIAVFCAQFSTQERWVDLNGNGRQDPGETSPNPTGETRGWFVEPDGTVWQTTLRGGILMHPVTEILPTGVPVYGQAARRTFPMPAPFTELRRLVYDRAADALYLAGATAQARAEHWKPMGPNLVRYDGWLGERRVAWHVVLPHEKGQGGHESYEPFDFAVEGDYVFVVYAGRLPSRQLPPGTVMVFTKRDRRYVGHFQPDGIRTGTVPMDALQDMVHSLNVFRRANGEYLVFIEDDGYTKNVMYRWTP
ncbi:MAG: NHL repeat-containing protein [Limisphaerales bacterium]